MILLFKIMRAVLVLTTFCSSGLTSVVALWWNAQLGGIIDTVSMRNPLTAITIIRALIAMVLTSAAAYVKGILSGYTCESMTHDLRMGYARHFASLPIAEVEELSTGEQLSRLQNEIVDVSGYLNGNFFQLLDDNIRFISTLAWLLIMNASLTVLANLPALIIIIYVVWCSKTISKATERSLQAKSRMNEYADTILTLFPIIRLYDAAKMMHGGYRGALQEWESQTIHAERTRARLMSLSALLSTIPLMLLFWVGGNMAIGGVITAGTLYIFFNLSGNLSGVLMNMPSYIAAFRQFAVSMKRLAPSVSIDERWNRK
jgi:ABC-type bacteriocin/lantibiotic exporter with double-glycine peptidase domain